jgi:hypothetical protein
MTERTINDIVKESTEQGTDSQWFVEGEERSCMVECEGCTGDPDCEHFISRMWYNQNVP